MRNVSRHLVTLLLGYYLFPLFAVSAAPKDSVEPDLPFSIENGSIRPLRQLLNPDLQRNLEESLRQNKAWDRLIQKKKMAVGLVDISDPNRVRFAHLNGNVMMYAASLPKLAILLAACQSFEDGTLGETPEILKDLRIMISQSDNSAATRMIKRMGFKKIESVLRDPRYELYDIRRGGGFWVGKMYAKEGNRYPDPLMGLSHAATVTQVCRYYYLLAMGKLVSFERSKQMLGILADPELHHKFVNSYDKLEPDAKLYRKSGTWRKWHSDSVLIWGPVWRRYIVAALVEDVNGEQILRDLIPTVDNLMNSQKLSSK